MPAAEPARRGASKVVDCFFNREGHSDFGAVADAHQNTVEQVVEVDGDFVERYLNEGDVDASELRAPLEQALREGHLIPVCFVSARTGAGVPTELLDIIVKMLPNPSEGNRPISCAAKATMPCLSTPRPTRPPMCWPRCSRSASTPTWASSPCCACAGGHHIRRDSRLFASVMAASRSRWDTCSMQGKEHIEVPRAGPGDLCAIGKVDERTTRCGAA